LGLAGEFVCCRVRSYHYYKFHASNVYIDNTFCHYELPRFDLSIYDSTELAIKKKMIEASQRMISEQLNNRVGSQGFLLVSLFYFAVIEPVRFVCIIISQAKSLELSRLDFPDFVVAAPAAAAPPALAIVAIVSAVAKVVVFLLLLRSW
jgi:hypothetical protein